MEARSKWYETPKALKGNHPPPRTPAAKLFFKIQADIRHSQINKNRVCSEQICPIRNTKGASPSGNNERRLDSNSNPHEAIKSTGEPTEANVKDSRNICFVCDSFPFI